MPEKILKSKRDLLGRDSGDNKVIFFYPKVNALGYEIVEESMINKSHRKISAKLFIREGRKKTDEEVSIKELFFTEKSAMEQVP